METWFKGGMDHGCCGGEGVVILEKGKRRGEHRGMHRESLLPKPLAWKMKGAEFNKFLQSMGLNVWRFKKCSGLGWDRGQRAVCCSWREGRQIAGATKHGNGDGGMPGTHRGDFLLF